MAARKSEESVRYPHLKRALKAYRKVGGTRAAVAKACAVTIDMARRYEEGWVMPRHGKLKSLAVLIGLSPQELQFGKLDPSLHPGISSTTTELTPDEYALLAAYRKLPAHAKESMRVHARRLMEEFVGADDDNPYGRRSET